ncbi:putative autophagy-related protein 11 [Amyelois transitella]|uniref:putative autophagy-related protein 11 n=1 Tax=Amyelois transitella TaxID=680683 RepID=UPI0029900415|nr:putative autophagy-related protein 11 [Amyelois transitella]
MSFITKRERVFNDYDLFDLPARNEGKLKAYASCTDARAWSHFCSDKSEHLVEIIKRNNDTCRPKYVPTDVIVDTLMVAKNAEIGRLKRKIEEFEQMLEAYDQLDLTCEQKCEIANAHAAIKAANKELDDMFLDLDLSGFTEGMDSDAFETGKSRGDEVCEYCKAFFVGPIMPAKVKEDEWVVAKPPPPVAEHKSNQVGSSCPCDASTNATDPRIKEMKEALINKDAKMGAMQNTIAVMENDVCEPYCIYAHIYTALEKIFGILCQNDKYKLYLNLMTAGKDTRCIDIKGKILYKLKVFEKFCQALIAPCSQTQEQSSDSQQDCSCYRAEVLQQLVPTAYALTTSEIQNPSLDHKRAHLVADIMENEEMKEILRKDSSSNINHDDEREEFIEDYDIDAENLKRLKNLQEDYDDLMTCYEALKHEKENLLLKCQKYEELDKEYDTLRNQLREYNLLWNEKEHYRKRSADLDSLKEQYLILADETTNMETQLKAESEIIKIKSNAIEELRNENVTLEKKLNDALIGFEKEKSILQCKLKETECKCMCQEQQIKSLSVQIDRLLEQETDKVKNYTINACIINLILIDEVESLKEQIKNLKDALLGSEEEKQNLSDEFQDNLKIIHNLRMEIEDWKSTYEKAMHRTNYLEDYAQHFEENINKLANENKQLSQDVKDKTAAVENLINVINNKSKEINTLLGEIEVKENENKDLLRQLNELRDIYECNISAAENEKKEVLESLSLAKRESEELMNKLKDYEELVQSQNDMTNSFEAKIVNYNQLKQALLDTIEENKNLEMSKALLLNEIQRLKEVHTYAVNDIDDLNEENNKYKSSLELQRKKSEILEDKLSQFESLSQELQSLQETHENIISDKRKLEKDLLETKYELENEKRSAEVSKKEIEELKLKSENLANELHRLGESYQTLVKEKYDLYGDLTEKNKKLLELQQSLDNLKEKNNCLQDRSSQINKLEKTIDDLKNTCAKLDSEKQLLQKDLYQTLQVKTEENTRLLNEITYLRGKHEAVKSNLDDLHNENLSTKQSLTIMRKESDELLNKLKYYENLENDFIKMRQDHYKVQMEKQQLQDELDCQLKNLKQIKQENNALQKESFTLMRHSEDMENALVDARSQLVQKSDRQDPYLAIKKEIEVMKEEKTKNLQRIRDLSNELDVMENIISNLTQDVSARDDKIAILENHINKLKDEITRLHGCLSVVIETGEQIKSTSYEKIDQSMQNMEAHHSKATHNMKMEIANLHKEKVKLEAQMSFTKLKTEESLKEKNNQKLLLAQLQNEREIIITDIKQLELQSVGDSSLSPTNCEVENILKSLDRIRKILDKKTSKNNSLEQALLKVQRSSQVLVNEAIDLVEKEKQKILNEKEEAIRDKQHLQNELLNQELIIGKLKNSTDSYISKLEEEMHSLQSLYQNSMAMVSELQEKNKSLSDQSKNNSDIIEKLQQELKQKSNEILVLQMALAQLKNKNTLNADTQTDLVGIKSTSSVQTERKTIKDSALCCGVLSTNDTETEPHKTTEENNILSILPKQRPHSINEVQILTANIEPTFDFVKSSYLSYKLKQLSFGRLEQQSISNYEVSIQETQLSESVSNSNDKVEREDNAIIDLYNRQCLLTDSSQIEYREPETSNSKTNYKNTTITSLFSGSNQTNKHKNDHKHMKISSIPKSENTIDRDLFVIYKESETDVDSKSHNDKDSWNSDKKISESMVNNRPQPLRKEFLKKKLKGKHNVQHDKHNTQDIIDNYSEVRCDEEDDDSVKPKLNIKLPRVVTDSQSIPTTSEGDRKSLDSYTMAIYLSPKETRSDNKIKSCTNVEKTVSQETPSLPTLSNDVNNFSHSNNSFSVPVYENKKKSKTNHNDTHLRSNESEKTTPLETKSVHKLSRVDADVYLIKSKEEIQRSPRKLDKDYGLQYILDAIKKENESELAESASYYTNKKMRKSHSEERLHPVKRLETNSQTKTITSSYSPSKINDNTQSKSVADRSVLVKIDNAGDYETKIEYLTKTLENVEKDYKKKIEAIKNQYDSNIKSIINEHNTGVKSIQNLHEETLQDIIKIHENEVENLRTLSIEAMRKSEKLERENRTLKSKIPDLSSTFDVEPTKICCNDGKRRRKSRTETLTKTDVEAFNVKPKIKSHGPCTCSLDINLSDTIRNIFEQVDIDQRKMAEHTYLKYIANKILSNTVEALDSQELSFLHLKVCRTWKLKLNKEEALQKKIDTLEHELMNKQRNAQQHIAELDRKVAEERRRLQEVREAVCRTPPDSRSPSPETSKVLIAPAPPAPPPTMAEKDLLCGCNTGTGDLKVNERRSAGDLVVNFPTRPKRAKESNRAVLARMDAEERRERRLYHDEPPTRLRRGHASERRPHKK